MEKVDLWKILDLDPDFAMQKHWNDAKNCISFWEFPWNHACPQCGQYTPNQNNKLVFFDSKPEAEGYFEHIQKFLTRIKGQTDKQLLEQRMLEGNEEQ